MIELNDGAVAYMQRNGYQHIVLIATKFTS